MYGNFVRGVLREEAGEGAGGGGAKPPAVDAAQIKTFVDASLKELLPSLIPGLLEGLKPHLVAPTEKTVPPTPVPTPPAAVSPEINSQLVSMRKTIEDQAKTLTDMTTREKAAVEEARTARKATAIDRVLDQFEFANPKARKSAFRDVEELIVMDAEGNIASNDNRTLEAFIPEFIMKENSHLLRAERAAGSGNTGRNNAASTFVNGKSVGIESIKLGMTDDEKKAVGAQLARVYSSEITNQ